MLTTGAMVKIEVGFTPEQYEERMIEQTKEDVQAKLYAHDLGQLKIVLKKRPGSQIAFQFLGDADGIDKAKRLLGIY